MKTITFRWIYDYPSEEWCHFVAYDNALSLTRNNGYIIRRSFTKPDGAPTLADLNETLEVWCG